MIWGQHAITPRGYQTHWPPCTSNYRLFRSRRPTLDALRYEMKDFDLLSIFFYYSWQIALYNHVQQFSITELSPFLFSCFGRAPVAQSAAYRTWEQKVARSIPGSANLFSRIRDNILSFHAAYPCFGDRYVGKQFLALTEYCAEY